MKKRLLEIIKERAYHKGNFKLSSGEISNYYIDLRQITMYPIAFSLIGELLFPEIRKYNIRAVGGPQCGAIPIISSIISIAYQHSYSLEGFWTRPKSKDHGTNKLIEGNVNNNTMIVDDVITSGNSVLQSIKTVEAMDCKVVKVIGIVDRLQGASKLLKNYNYSTLFTVEDLSL